MTEKEKLIRDIETLIESTRLDWAEFAGKPAERAEIVTHIDACMKDVAREQLSSI